MLYKKCNVYNIVHYVQTKMTYVDATSYKTIPLFGYSVNSHHSNLRKYSMKEQVMRYSHDAVWTCFGIKQH